MAITSRKMEEKIRQLAYKLLKAEFPTEYREIRSQYTEEGMPPNRRTMSAFRELKNRHPSQYKACRQQARLVLTSRYRYKPKTNYKRGWHNNSNTPPNYGKTLNPKTGKYE